MAEDTRQGHGIEGVRVVEATVVELDGVVCDLVSVFNPVARVVTGRDIDVPPMVGSLSDLARVAGLSADEYVECQTSIAQFGNFWARMQSLPFDPPDGLTIYHGRRFPTKHGKPKPASVFSQTVRFLQGLGITHPIVWLEDDEF